MFVSIHFRTLAVLLVLGLTVSGFLKTISNIVKELAGCVCDTKRTRSLLKLGHCGGGEDGLGELSEELFEEAGHDVGLVLLEVGHQALVVAVLEVLHLRLHARDPIDPLARQA